MALLRAGTMSVSDPGDLAPPSATAAQRATLAVVALGDVALFGWSLVYGARMVSDGAGSITNGYNVAISIGVTLLAALGVGWLRLPPTLRFQAQVVMLVGQGLHALGHLARWYYVLPWYDDLLHFTLAAVGALLLMRLAEAWDVFPAVHATPLRAALVAFTLALAIAAAWEIFEFTMDQLQGTREQDDLVDTMRDMVDALLGGVVAAFLAYRFPRPREATS